MRFSSTTYYLTLAILIALAMSQNSDPPKNEESIIIIGASKNIELKAYQTKTFTLTINQKVTENQNMYITAESSYNDPFEQPRITVVSDKDFYLLCSEDSNDFIGICQIDNQQLKQNRKFSISFYCEIDCRLYVSAYLSSTYLASLGDSLTLKNYQSTPMTQNILFELSKDEQFTQIMIVATPTRSQKFIDGLTMMANYGPSPAVPTIDKYSMKGQSTSAHRQSIFLSKEEIKPGEKIMMSLLLSPNMQISLTSKFVNKNVYQLYLGEPAYDFTTSGQARQYILDLSEYQSQNLTFDETLLIKFVTFSGTPDVIVAFDQNFTSEKRLDSWTTDSAFSFQITPAIRKQKGYAGNVYINISSYWSTNFYLQASVNRKPFIDIQPQVMEFVHITPKDIKNVIFIDENYEKDLEDDGIIDYKVNIKMLPGELEFSVRNCGTYKQGKTLDCMINNTADLQKQDIKNSFNQIKYTIEKVSGVFYDTYIVRFNYNVKQKCQLSNDTRMIYVCKFQMIFFQTPDKGTKDLTAGIEVQKNTISRWLKQGQYESNTVMKSQMNYYAFSLPSIENIDAIQFFVTVKQGDVSLLVSKQIKYPSLTDLSNNNDIIFSLFNTVVIYKQNLKAGTYYIGIYGYAMSDYNIAVAISRSKNKSNDTATPDDNSVQVTQIKLTLGQSSTYTLPAGKSLSKFVFSPSTNKQMSIVKVDQIQGDVEYTVADKDNLTKFVCDSAVIRETGDDECLFQSQQFHNYVLVVKGKTSQVQIFSVLYTVQQQCDSYPWNFPYYVNLDKGQTVCLAYTAATMDDIHVSIYMSNYQIITSNISFLLKFPNKEIKLSTQEQIISKSQLLEICKGKQQKCSFTINMTNQGNTDFSFLLAVQNAEGQNVLFDGVPTKITTPNISNTNSKKFYYYLFGSLNNQDVNVYLTSLSQSKYQVGLRLVSNDEFSKDFNQSLYPQFNQKGDNMVVTNSSLYSPITILTLQKQILATKIKSNQTGVILVSVFGIPSQSIDSTFAFKLQLSQSTSQLQVGDSKIGYVQKDNVYQIQIDLTGLQSASIQVREVSDDECLIAYLVSPNKKTEMKQIEHTINFNKEQGKRNILFKTNADTCTFQVSFKSSESSIVTIMPSVPYSVEISNSKIKYFLYYHSSKQTFYILQMVSSGRSYAYAQPLKADDKVLQMVKNLKISDYKFQGQINGDVEIDKNSSNFCSNCYYLIAIEGNPDSIAELTINPQNVPILLKEGALLRDRIDLEDIFSYQVYSTVSFNISLTILYGSVEITVIDPSGKEVAKQLATVSELIVVQAPKVTTNKNMDYFNDAYRYIIKVRGMEDSSYYINVVKRVAAFNLFEGFPVNIKLNANQPFLIEYDNALQTEFINLLVQDLSYYANNMTNVLNFQASFTGNTNPIKNVSSSQSSYNLKLFAQKGTYSINVTSKISTEISVMVAKNQLMHLSAGRTYMMDRQSIFQIFSPGDSIVIEIYSCSGNVAVKASTNYSILTAEKETDEGIVRMEHANYGGHYVISAENLKGQYFVQVNQQSDEQNTPLSYLISYYLFDTSKGDKMPYRVYTMNNDQIRYKYVLGGVEFTMSRVSRKDHVDSEGDITYKLYISNNTAAIEQMTRCSLGQVYTSTQTVPLSKKGTITFKFETSKIREIIGNADSYLVGGEATLNLKKSSPKFLGQANFVYKITQLNANQQVQFKQQGKSGDDVVNILVWLVIPFLVGSFLLFLAARFLLRSFSTYPTQLIEQDDHTHGESQEVVQNNSNSQPVPPSGLKHEIE